MQGISYKGFIKLKIDQERKLNDTLNFLGISSRDKFFESIISDIKAFGKSVGLNVPDENTLRTYFDTSVKEYLSVNPIDPGISHSLTNENFKSWLDTDRKETVEWNYSDRYFEYLLESGRSLKVVEETEISSLSVIGKMADPKSSKPSYKKGLVVGAVQSGKTGNFNAVINRAIDVGYEMIIVLSGIMEDLRSQTQKRIEKDVVGEGSKDGERTGKKGVGYKNRFGTLGGSDIVQIKSLTSETKDFSKTVKDLDHTLNDKYILVCKKNVSVLKNLIIWLHNSLEDGKEKHNIPLLIIDDEADNASLNNLGAKGRNYASKTNGHIRAILELFHVKSYVGYTATPFANVLQDRNQIPENDWEIKFKNRKKEDVTIQLARVDNLFPDHFIELLSPPSNYVGAKQIFDTVHPLENQTDDNDKIPLISPVVNDYISQFPTRLLKTKEDEIIGVENITSNNEWIERFGYDGYLGFSSYSEYRRDTFAARKEDSFPKELPESLKTAIKCFILSLAIRQSRIPSMIHSDLYQKHNTMLIHISRFTYWQNTTKKLVAEYINNLISRLENEKIKDSKSIYSELRNLWYSNYGFAHIIENIRLYLPSGHEDEFMSPLVFDSLIPLFPQAIKGIEVKAINSFTKDTLDYPEDSPKKYIAIGGNRLSRGFTLEGLTINYFIRVTNYSDALLQMGRWFGYRPGYLDCCKIFTTQDSLEKFHETTKCIEELENEFIKMEEQGKTPQSFAIRVKKHPGTLKITRPSILKNAIEVKWSFQDSLVMTTQLKVDKLNIVSIWDNFKENIAPKFDKQTEKNDILFFNTTGAEIISILKNQPNNFNDKDPEYLSKFIQLCNEKGYLNEWTVGLKITGTGKEISKERIGLSDNLKLNYNRINLAKRKGPESRNDIDLFINRKLFRATSSSANITSSNEDLAITLSSSQMIDAREKFYKDKTIEYSRKNKSWSKNEAEKKARSHKTIPEKYYREKMNENQGLLMIYLFDSEIAFNQSYDFKNADTQKEFKKYIDSNDLDNIIGEIPLVGYALEFPPLENDPGGYYLQGDYDLSLDEDIDEEINDELDGITDIIDN